jgi:hypothetical protein
MNANREELLFQLALLKPAEGRAEFLSRECSDDDKALRSRIEALLAAHEQSGGVLAVSRLNANESSMYRMGGHSGDPQLSFSCCGGGEDFSKSSSVFDSPNGFLL